MRINIVKPLAVLPAALASAVPTAAFAVDYLNQQQAQQALFPTADRFDARDVRLDAAQLQALQQRYGVNARSANWKVLVATQAGKALGYVVIDNVVGKFELITYAVGLSVEGVVKQVEIMSYRESHGGEIRLPAWRQQFVGKGAQAPIKTGQDIANISGATLSCRHLTDGVKRVLTLHALKLRTL